LREKYKGEFEERLKSVVKEVTAAEGDIVYLLMRSTLVGAGEVLWMHILKPALAVENCAPCNPMNTKSISKDATRKTFPAKTRYLAQRVVTKTVKSDYRRSNYHNGILNRFFRRAIDLMDEAASKNT
jgi:ATP-dependent Clp protease ATP-binding subunit ClpA